MLRANPAPKKLFRKWAVSFINKIMTYDIYAQTNQKSMSIKITCTTSIIQDVSELFPGRSLIPSKLVCAERENNSGSSKYSGGKFCPAL